MTEYFLSYLLIFLFKFIFAEAIDNHNSSIRIGHKVSRLSIPDSDLLILDRLRLHTDLDISSRARQKQKPKQKPATVSSNSTSSSSSSSSTTTRGPCTCSLGICKCCTGYVMDIFNQKACMKVTYHPGDFAFDVAMSLNNRVLYENSLSGRNPKPICISPPRLNNLKVCAKFYNVFFPGRNFHFCLAMDGKWRSVQLFDFTFDCMRMGANGIAMLKPDDLGGLPIPNPLGGVDAVIDSGEEDIEDYNENVVKSIFGMFDDDEDDDDYDEDEDR